METNNEKQTPQRLDPFATAEGQEKIFRVVQNFRDYGGSEDGPALVAAVVWHAMADGFPHAPPHMETVQAITNALFSMLDVSNNRPAAYAGEPWLGQSRHTHAAHAKDHATAASLSADPDASTGQPQAAHALLRCAFLLHLTRERVQRQAAVGFWGGSGIDADPPAEGSGPAEPPDPAGYRDCRNCKHGGKARYEHPCRHCGEDEPNGLWEPKEAP